eukprot:4891987-Alexandrium_andersonii.AAC.1
MHAASSRPACALATTAGGATPVSCVAPLGTELGSAGAGASVSSITAWRRATSTPEDGSCLNAYLAEILRASWSP